MLTFDAGLFDPARRPDAIEEGFVALGLDPEDVDVAAAIQGVTDVLETIFGDSTPATTSEQLGMVTKYVAVLIAGVNATVIGDSARFDAIEARLDALEAP